MKVIVYTRVGCHLCEDAEKLLEKEQKTRHFDMECVDVDKDPLLREKYDECVPVVVIDGVERFRGRVNEVLLRRLFR